jgi:hypothetical protein
MSSVDSAGAARARASGGTKLTPVRYPGSSHIVGPLWRDRPEFQRHCTSARRVRLLPPGYSHQRAGCGMPVRAVERRLPDLKRPTVAGYSRHGIGLEADLSWLAAEPFTAGLGGDDARYCRRLPRYRNTLRVSADPVAKPAAHTRAESRGSGPAKAASSERRTLRWRKPDSNFWSLKTIQLGGVNAGRHGEAYPSCLFFDAHLA